MIGSAIAIVVLACAAVRAVQLAEIADQNRALKEDQAARFASKEYDA